VIRLKKIEVLVYPLLTDSLKNSVCPPTTNNLSVEVKMTIVGRPLTGEK
jgi:hypothetical protein